jgi:hypothetical protein
MSKKEKDDNFDLKRMESHRIYNIPVDWSKFMFKRNCKFDFKMSKDQKIYQKKKAELKVELFDDRYTGEGERIGYKELNLSEYIKKGLRKCTFQMDDLGNIFITVMISVLDANANMDIT